MTWGVPVVPAAVSVGDGLDAMALPISTAAAEDQATTGRSRAFPRDRWWRIALSGMTGTRRIPAPPGVATDRILPLPGRRPTGPSAPCAPIEHNECDSEHPLTRNDEPPAPGGLGDGQLQPERWIPPTPVGAYGSGLGCPEKRLAI